MSVYIDDVVMSGEKVTGNLIPPCMEILRRYELIGHKVAYFTQSDVKVITGVSVDTCGLGIPNKRRRKIRALFEERARAIEPEEKMLYQNALVGLLRESSSLDSSLKVLATNVERGVQELR